MTSDQKSKYWQQHFKDWAASGLSQKDYCLDHSLKISTFSYWRKKINGNVGTGSKLIPLAIPRSESISIMLPGIRIDVPASSLSLALPVIMQSLREAR